jgi:hypothetical protein
MTAPTPAMPWPHASASPSALRVQRTTLGAQTWHMIRWDAVLLWRWWVALVLLCVVAALQSTAVASGSAVVGGVLGVGALALTTMLMIITAVHHDRPDDPQAFWQGLPIDARAHALAKTSLTITTLVPLAASAAWSLYHAGIEAVQVPRHLLLPLFTSWKLNLMALAFATCTRRTGFTLVAMLASWLLPFMLSGLLLPSNFSMELLPPSATLRGVVLLASVFGVGALIWMAYRLRELPVAVRLFIASVAGWGLWFGDLTAPAAPEPALPVVDDGAAAVGVSNIVEVDGHLRLDLRAQGLDATRRYELRGASIRWERTPGDTAIAFAMWSPDTTLRTRQELAVTSMMIGDSVVPDPSPMAATAFGLRSPELKSVGSLSLLRGAAPGRDSLRTLRAFAELLVVRLHADSLTVAAWKAGTLFRGQGIRVDLRRDWVNGGSGWQLTTSAFRSANIDPLRVRLSDFESLLDVRPVRSDGQRGQALVPIEVSNGTRPVILPGLNALTSTQQFEALASSELDPTTPRVQLALWKREGQLRLTASLPDSVPAVARPSP